MLRASTAALFAAALLFPSCAERSPEAPRPRTVSSKDELVLWLDTLETTYERACRQVGLANWHSYAKDAPYDLDGAKRGMGAIFNDTAAGRIIEEWRNRSNSLADKPLARRLEMWHRIFTGGRIYTDAGTAPLEDKLQQTITDFPFALDGKPVKRAALDSLLRTEKREQRRHAVWAVRSKLSAAAAPQLARLIAARNKLAAAAGYPDYYSLSLHLNGIDEAWLLSTIAALEEQTRGRYEEFTAASAHRLRQQRLHLWDLDYALRDAGDLPDRYFPGDSVFPVIHAFETGIGFHVDSLPISEGVRDIPYGGLNLAILIPGDTRFLVSPRKGHRFYETAFHEYGHALKAVHTASAFASLKGYEWIPGAQCAAFEEGVADMHAAFTDDSLWLATTAGIKPRVLEKYLTARDIPEIVRLRREMKDFAVEYAMYKHPDADLAKAEREAIGKYLLVDVDSTEAPQYAVSIWYASYPCYYQNYILAAMIAAQLQEALAGKFGSDRIADTTVAPWMITHLYAGGEQLEWNERIRNAT